MPFLSDYYGNKHCLSKTGMKIFQQTIKEFYRLLLTLQDVLQALYNTLTPDLLLGRSLRFRSVEDFEVKQKSMATEAELRIFWLLTKFILFFSSF